MAAAVIAAPRNGLRQLLAEFWRRPARRQNTWVHIQDYSLWIGAAPPGHLQVSGGSWKNFLGGFSWWWRGRYRRVSGRPALNAPVALSRCSLELSLPRRSTGSELSPCKAAPSVCYGLNPSTFQMTLTHLWDRSKAVLPCKNLSSPRQNSPISHVKVLLSFPLFMLNHIKKKKKPHWFEPFFPKNTLWHFGLEFNHDHILFCIT